MFATITLFIAGLLSTSPRLPKHPSSFLFVHLIREPSFGQSYHELELRALLQGLFSLTLCRMHTCDRDEVALGRIQEPRGTVRLYLNCIKEMIVKPNKNQT